MKFFFPALLIFSFLINIPANAKINEPNGKFVSFRVGFFLGGRTATFFRYWKSEVHKQFKISLITKDMRKNEFYEITNFKNSDIKSNFAKATGDELAQLVLQGKVDMALVGETSFLKIIDKNLPLIAIAETGHDVSGEAGHAMIFRSDIDIRDPKKWKGLTFGARRSSGGDLTVLKEFILSVGLDPYKDVKIIDQIDDDIISKYLKHNKVDAAYFHLAKARNMIAKNPGKFIVYKKLDWVKPEISSTYLVVKKDFLEKNRAVIQTMLSRYSASIVKEKSYASEHRLKKNVKGIQMEENFMGMNFPQSYDCPYVRTELLEEWEKILFKHKVVSKINDISKFIDNSLFKCKKT
jgi:ABC-type nitrate/sulfonate/bicarbonate transport system substrate-binding protein